MIDEIRIEIECIMFVIHLYEIGEVKLCEDELKDLRLKKSQLINDLVEELCK